MPRRRTESVGGHRQILIPESSSILPPGCPTPRRNSGFASVIRTFNPEVPPRPAPRAGFHRSGISERDFQPYWIGMTPWPTADGNGSAGSQPLGLREAEAAEIAAGDADPAVASPGRGIRQRSRCHAATLRDSATGASPATSVEDPLRLHRLKLEVREVVAFRSGRSATAVRPGKLNRTDVGQVPIMIPGSRHRKATGRRRFAAEVKRETVLV